jgi:WD40 repeat protein
MPGEGRLWYWSGEVRLWDLATGKQRGSVKEHFFPKGTVQRVAFAPDGKVLASAGGKAVKLWDLATGLEQAEVQEEHSESWFWVMFTGNGMTLLSRHPQVGGRVGQNYDRLEVWEVPAKK